tara:strand:+ start:6794 stop:6919 length:126 start_codon:yes stop_codon:yes gene_type:complete
MVDVDNSTIVRFENFKQEVTFQIKPNKIIELKEAINGIAIL